MKFIAALVLGLSFSVASADSDVPLKLVQSIALPDIDGEKRDRLYIAAPPSGVLGARLLVFEAQTD